MARRIASYLLIREGKILFQKRTDDAPYFPSVWSFFGGEIESGETPMQGAAREAKEELNYDLQNPQLIHSQNEDQPDAFFVFIDEFDDSQALELLEGAAMKWMTAKEALQLEMIPDDKAILKQLFDKKKV